ncbi:MAG: hypothetical protein RLN79_04030 [Cytophagales bacterium]
MKKLRFIIIMLGLCLFQNVQAQIDPNSIGYYQDALRFSSTDRGGTARLQGLAGSGVALGGDLSSVIINPAGLGFYNRSVLSITPQISFRDNTASFQGQDNVTFNDKFSVGQIGISIDLTKSDIEKGDFRGGSLAFSFSKRNDFNEEIELIGENYQSSIVDYYLESAQGIYTSDLYRVNNGEQIPANPIGMAYDAFLFDIDINACNDPADCNIYERFYAFEPMRQRELIRTSGNQNEWTVSYGGNFKDQFYFGTKLGIASVNYLIERTYNERALDQGTDALRSTTINDRLEIDGTGFNLGLGFIYRPVDLIRFGLNFETPTYYALEEDFDADLSAQFNNFLFFEDPNNPDNNFYLNNESSSLPNGFFNYRLRTPMKVNFGAAIFASKNGFITADVEYLDYSRSRLSFESLDGDESADNRSIQNIYDRTFNFRVGAEYRVDDFRFRGGYANLGDPFKENINLVDQSRQRVSGGLGMRLQDYFWDVALIHEWWNEGYTLYNLQNGYAPAAEFKKNLTTLAITGGLFF